MTFIQFTAKDEAYEQLKSLAHFILQLAIFTNQIIEIGRKSVKHMLIMNEISSAVRQLFIFNLCTHIVISFTF